MSDHMLMSGSALGQVPYYLGHPHIYCRDGIEEAAGGATESPQASI